MSPWSHSELRVVVCPWQIALSRAGRTPGLRGQRLTIGEPHIVPCNSAGGAPPWRAALQSLEAALLLFADGKTAAAVVLSNHFLRYILVPWRAELTDAEEELSFARHCFGKVYGKAAQQWDVRLNQEAPGTPRLASAVDTELLGCLRTVFDGARIPLQSIQPHLMASFNGFRSRLQQHDAWFALVEPGNLCLALLQRGRWSRVRSLRIDSAWREELPLILDREAYLADEPEPSHEAYVWSAESGDTALPEAGPWRFHVLGAGQAPGAMAEQGAYFSTALAG